MEKRPHYMCLDFRQNTFLSLIKHLCAHTTFRKETKHTEVEVSEKTYRDGKFYNRFGIGYNTASLVNCPKIKSTSTIVYGDGRLAGQNPQEQNDFLEAQKTKTIADIL